MVLDVQRNLQEGLTLHKPQLLQRLQTIGECFRADMTKRCSQGVKAHWPLQQIHDNQQYPRISQQTDSPCQRGCTGFMWYGSFFQIECFHETSISYVS